VIYRHNNTILEIINSKGTLFHNGKLLFKGFGYTAIQEFIRLSGNSPEAKKQFASQLKMREKCKFKKIDDDKAHERQLKGK